MVSIYFKNFMFCSCKLCTFGDTILLPYCNYQLFNTQSTKKMCVLYQWGQIDPCHDSYSGVVFVVFLKAFFLFST